MGNINFFSIYPIMLSNWFYKFLYQYNMITSFIYHIIGDNRKGAIISPLCPCFVKSVSFAYLHFLFDNPINPFVYAFSWLRLLCLFPYCSSH